MIEYPSIINSRKAPRENCIMFDKLDGSNMRFEWTNKNGFCSFGTRTQLIDEKTPLFGRGVTYFLQNQAPILHAYFLREFPNLKEIIVYGEFYGPNSFAGSHIETEQQKVTVFDILLGHNVREFIKPDKLISQFGNLIELPKVVYVGN